MGDFNKAISILKEHKAICNIQRKYDLKLQCYKLLSDTYSAFKNYTKSIIYLKKMLKLAWKISN